jgi:hypothetical protein
MQDERKAVLERVARGELSPTEAAALLDDLEEREAPPEADPRDWAAGWARPDGGVPPQVPPPPAGDAASRVRVLRPLGTADIIGDPSVREAVAEGPHVARREGETLVIQGHDDWFGTMPGWEFNWNGPGRRGRHRRLRHHHRLGWEDIAPLRVRVNPDLPLEIESRAGRLRVRGVHGPIRCSVQAGEADIVDFRSPLDLSVQAGSLTARGRLDGGASRIRCDAGSVRVLLERGSSVRVSAHTMLGKVSFGQADARSPWTIGAGEGTLDIDGTMGHIRVDTD